MAIAHVLQAGESSVADVRPSWVEACRRLLLQTAVALGELSRDMSFLDHLEKLRRRILWGLGFVGIVFGVCWLFSTELYQIASTPIRANPEVTLSIRRPQDIFNLHLKVTMVASIFAAAPFLLAQAWMFISPGLYRHERRYAIPFVFSASVLFLAGGAFGYFIAFPITLRFLIQWTLESGLTPIIDAIEYFNLFFMIMVALGVVFQIPAVIFVLSRIGLINAGMLLRNAKYAVLGCVFVAALITPTTDVTTMMTIAGPMMALYGVGIVVAWIFGKDRKTYTKQTDS